MSSAATAKSILWAAIEVGSLTVLSLLTVIVLARLLGPAEFGLAALALAIVQILILFVETPFTDAIVQRQNLGSAHVVSAFWATCVIALILIVGCVAAAGAIAEAFDDPRLSSVTRWLALSVGFSALSSVPIAQLRRNMQFKQVALRSVLSRSMALAVAAGMAYNGFGVWSIVAQQIVATGMMATLLWTVGRPRGRYSASHLKDLAWVGAPIFAARFMSVTAGRILNMMIGYYIGITALGHWNVAMRVVETLSGLLAQAAGTVGLSVFARRQTELEVMQRGYYAAAQMGTLLSVPLFTGLIVVAEELVALVLGVQWLPAVPLIQIAAFGTLLYFTLMFADVVFIALGKPGWTLLVNIFNLGLNVTGFLVFYESGLVVVALAWTATGFLTAPLTLKLIRKLIQIEPAALARNVAQPFIAGSLMALLLFVLKLQLPLDWPVMPRLALLVSAGALTYVVSIWILAPSLLQRCISLGRTAMIREPAPLASDRSANP